MELKEGRIYIDKTTGKRVEFGYMGATGFAIVYEPGERNMQDSYAIRPDKLIYEELDFSKELIKLMGQKGLTVKDIRRIAGVSKPTVAHWLEDRNTPHLAMQIGLFETLRELPNV